MKKKNVMLGCIVAIALMVVLSTRGAAEKTASGIPFATDKSDRTLIKEIHVNQQEMLNLLQEIKAMLADKE